MGVDSRRAATRRPDGHPPALPHGLAGHRAPRALSALASRRETGVDDALIPQDLARLRSLLLGQRLIALGVSAEGVPIVGLLPYAVSEDGCSLYVQSSSLARHSRGLTAGAPWSGLIHEPDAPEMDALQVPRLQLEGTVDPLNGDRPELRPAAFAFRKRFPQAAQTLELPDFTLYRLEIQGGRMVLGFGRALNLSAAHFLDVPGAVSNP